MQGEVSEQKIGHGRGQLPEVGVVVGAEANQGLTLLGVQFPKDTACVQRRLMSGSPRLRAAKNLEQRNLWQGVLGSS